jgi:hypothetical protein
MLRTGCYIDGFNLYHAVDDLADHALKWVNLQAVAISLLRAGDALAFTKYFSALSTWSAEKRARHLAFIKAQQVHGVEVRLLGFKTVEKKCLRSGRSPNSTRKSPIQSEVSGQTGLIGPWHCC